MCHLLEFYYCCLFLKWLFLIGLPESDKRTAIFGFVYFHCVSKKKNTILSYQKYEFFVYLSFGCVHCAPLHIGQIVVNWNNIYVYRPCFKLWIFIQYSGDLMNEWRSHFDSLAGTCWLKRYDDGRCKQPWAQKVTRDECCGSHKDVGYTDVELSSFQYFLAVNAGSGNCQSCIGKLDKTTCWYSMSCVCALNASPFSIANDQRKKKKKTRAQHSIVVRTSDVWWKWVNRNACARWSAMQRKKRDNITSAIILVTIWWCIGDSPS